MPNWLGGLGGAGMGFATGGPIGGIVGGLAGLFGGGGSGGTAKVGPTSPTFRRAEQLGDLSKGYAFDYALPEGKKLMGEAESTLQLPTDYWSKLMSGDRASMMSAEAPEIQNFNDLYSQQQKNISKFTPQGGGQTAALTEGQFSKARDIGTMLEKARPEAAKELQSIAGQQAAMSGQVTSEGLQAGQLSLSAISDQINALLGKSAQDIPLQQQTGAGLYSLLKGMKDSTSTPSITDPNVDETGGKWGGGWDWANTSSSDAGSTGGGMF